MLKLLLLKRSDIQVGSSSLLYVFPILLVVLEVTYYKLLFMCHFKWFEILNDICPLKLRSTVLNSTQDNIITQRLQSLLLVLNYLNVANHIIFS